MNDQAIRKWVCNHLAEVLGVPAQQVDLKRTLESYGLDSVEAVLMAGALEDEFHLQIDPAGFLQYPNLEAMVVALEQPRVPGGAKDRPSSGTGPLP
jgi:acyl carrier protein